MERRRYMDIVKGICMIVIVLGHCGHSIPLLSHVKVYGFYFVSGYTYNSIPFMKFTMKKIKGLYIPFVVNCLFALPVIKALSVCTKGLYNADFSIKNIIGIFEFNIPSNYLAPAWFVLPLFIIYFLYYGIERTIKNNYAILVLAFVMYAVSFIFRSNLEKYIWNDCAWILNVFWGLFVFSLGRELRNNNKIEDVILCGGVHRLFEFGINHSSILCLYQDRF